MKIDNHHRLPSYTSHLKSLSCSCLLARKTSEQVRAEPNQLKETEKTRELFKAKPVQVFLSKGILDDDYVAVSVNGRVRPIYISISELSEITGIERSALRSFNEQTLVQVMYALSACHFFNQAKASSSQHPHDKLLDILFILPTSNRCTFLKWLKDPSHQVLMNQIQQAIEENKALPWKEILQDQELIEFLDGVLQSDEDRLILQNRNVMEIMSILSAKQLSFLADRLKQDFTFTFNFLIQLGQGNPTKSNPDFELEPSKNAEFNQKLKTLIDFLEEENISSFIGRPFLLFFLCQPDLELKNVYPLLKSLKSNAEMAIPHLFDLVDLVQAEPRLATQLSAPCFLQAMQKDTVNELISELTSVRQKGLFPIFCALSAEKAFSFLKWLKDPNHLLIMNQIQHAIEDKKALPWSEIFQDQELLEFLDVVLQSENDRLILKDGNIQNIVRSLPIKQQKLLIDQLQQHTKLTLDFVDQLVQWDPYCGTRFQIRQASENRVFDQKVQILANFIYKEEIFSDISRMILLSLLCQPDLDLEALLILLERFKNNHINIDCLDLVDLFNLVGLIHADPRVATQLMDPHFLSQLKTDPCSLVNELQFLEQNRLLSIFCALPAEKAFSFFNWSKEPSHQLLINQTHQVLEGKKTSPWSEVLHVQEWLEFLDAMPFLSDVDRWMLQNEDVHQVMSMLPAKQQNLLVNQLEKDFNSTSGFLVQIARWMQDPSARFQAQPSGNAEFDQKAQRLANFLDQEKIPSKMGGTLLLSLLCQPDQDLEALFSLLKNLKENTYIRTTHIFNLIDSVHAEPRVKARLNDPHFLGALPIDSMELIVNLLFVQQNGLLDIFCAFPEEKGHSFLDWLSFSRSKTLILEVCQTIRDKQTWPWEKIDRNDKLVEFLAEALPLKSQRWVMQNKSVRNLMNMLPNTQQSLLMDQLEQNFKFVSDFLLQLSQWSQDSSIRFQAQPSGNVEFDQKAQRLANFLDQEKIPSHIGLPLLVSFLCQPNIDLEALYPLLKSIKASQEKINADHLFYLVHAEPQVKAQLNRPRFLTLMQQGKVNVNMLVGALKKVDEKLKSLAMGQRHYEKKKLHEHYGFTIDEKGHYFVRTYSLGKGNFKKAAKAVSDIEKDLIVLSFTPKGLYAKYNDSQPLKELEKEEKILNLGLKNVMPPFISTQVASNDLSLEPGDKFFAVQVEMSGDGERLILGPPKQILYVMTDVVQALVALHQSGFYHSDFKPGNLLFKGDPHHPHQPIKGYLHDFGCTVDVQNPQIGGSLAYIPPETINLVSQTDPRKVDVYAVGVSLIKLLLGVENFNAQKAFCKATSQQELDHFIYQQITNFDASHLSEEEIKIMVDLLKMAMQLVKLDHAIRPSCQEALARLEELKSKYPFPSLFSENT